MTKCLTCVIDKTRQNYTTPAGDWTHAETPSTLLLLGVIAQVELDSGPRVSNTGQTPLKAVLVVLVIRVDLEELLGDGHPLHGLAGPSYSVQHERVSRGQLDGVSGRAFLLAAETDGGVVSPVHDVVPAEAGGFPRLGVHKHRAYLETCRVQSLD